MAADENPQSVATRRRVIVGLSAGVAALRTPHSHAEAAGVVARNMESIHQEITFEAPPERIYTALTDAGEFHKVVLRSGAVRSGMVKMTQPTQISREAGGAFALFGAVIVGRQIELVPNMRIVQAWRAVDWGPGVYSIARFELVKQGTGTRLVFDHTGFPKGQAEHLVQGWNTNYWQPLAQVLS